MSYSGPLRDEPLAIELHNTLYAAAGEAIDGLADEAGAAAFIAALATRLPEGDATTPAQPTAAELIALRNPIRLALHAAIDGTPPDLSSVETINHAAAKAPASICADVQADGSLRSVVDHHRASGAQIILAAFASDAIELLTGPHVHELRVCDAPGCVLVYLRDHPRRQWCCNTCGNRARQARHYHRTRDAA